MKVKYRPEIDGLRAIAVCAVILYHAELVFFGHQIFIGGFLGVDIFFVISGYLITSIILNEIIKTNYFSIKRFYERRIRRIIPLLLFIIIFFIPIAWICLTPLALIDFSKSVISSLGFISNIYFYFSGQEYGNFESHYKPFLHTWSLSVEEQYYIIFPILIYFFFKYIKKYFFLFFFILIVSSLFLAEIGSKNFSSFNFYMLFSRIWELSLGSIISFLEYNKVKINLSNFIEKFLPKLGMALIIICFFLFDDDLKYHPSFYTLIPVIGTSLIIFFSNKNEITNKILSLKLFVGIGLISYSLYLWHFPFFAFVRITEILSGNIINKIFLTIAIIVLSIFTYYFVEKPFRNKKISFKLILSLLTAIISIIVILNSIIIFKDGFKSRMPKNLQNVDFKDSHRLIKDENGNECLDKQNGCIFNPSSQNKIYIIGDSHAATLTYDLKDKLIYKGYSLITSLISGCGFFPDFNLVNTKTNKIDKNCNKIYFQNLNKKLLSVKNSTIIISTRLPLYLDNLTYGEKGRIEKWQLTYTSDGKFKNLKDSFKESIKKISKNNKIILVYPNPEIGRYVSRELLNQHLKEKYSNHKNFEKNITISIEQYFERTRSSFELLDSINGENIFKVYPHKLFCDTIIKKQCSTKDNKDVFYVDDHHLSLAGSKKINDVILKYIE